MKLIVGLGNPDQKYENTRHNIGFMVLDNYLVNEKWSKKFDGLIIEKNINNDKIIFLKPLTYMNNSGFSVKKAVDFYHIDFDDILIIHDDLSLDFGSIRLKYDSSSGGHNGIKSIINCLGNQKFCQLKIGIMNEYKSDTIDFVLSKFSKDELINLDYNKCVNIINSFIINGIDVTMNNYNSN